jgi:hypothetical protein
MGVKTRSYCLAFVSSDGNVDYIKKSVMGFRQDNHYVSRMYLELFATSPGYVLTYPILVAHERVPLWKQRSIKGIAYREHLYTRIVAEGQTDEIEAWFNKEFETPAEDALRKATEDMRLTPSDWKKIIRFVAAQDVRTPARLVEDIQRWKEAGPSMLEETLKESVRKLELAKSRGEEIKSIKVSDSEYFPVRVTSTIKPGEKLGEIKAEMIVGRDLWLFGIRRLLTQTAKVLLEQKWSILSPPEGLEWFTSDDPVVRLNYYGENRYDFKGGWGNPGTEIFLPLSPRHLLYTKVGFPRPARGTVVNLAEAKMFRHFIAEHAHRYIFSKLADAEIPKLRPRTIDAAALRDEREQWSRWHEEQSRAKRELMGWTENAV